MNISIHELKPWYWVISYFNMKDDIKVITTDHGLVFAHHIAEAQNILSEMTTDDKVIINSNIKQIEINNGYCIIGNIKAASKSNLNDKMMLSVEPQEDVVWKLWGGWKGNHDKRIEDARCSKCKYPHLLVKGSLDKLREVCPGCGSIINEVEYEDGKREKIYR